ncbi:S24 family peptidase [uncultured Aureimonas sp.]|uniref:XRE family transcriptional regulator n=1 Tax=uncultured Aureimonas sp. TaxID=1604662 RepID=UPI0025D1B035|nr:S24 family peptidase [uncultured Aureimonas sp.]
MDGMTLATRLKARMDEVGMSQAELARRLGLAQPTIAKLVSGASQRTSHLHRIARELSTTPAYLIGETEDPSEGAVPLPTLETVLEQFGQVFVPLLDLSELVGGPSTTATPRFEPFRRERIEPMIRGRFDQVFAFEMQGDAMEPTLRHGTLCLVDRAQDRIVMQDEIYVVAVQSMIAVKRVRAKPDGSFVLMADNRAIPDDHAETENLRVIGRLVWRADRL